MRDAAVMASPVRSRGRVAAAVGLGGAMGAGLRHAVAVRFPASPGLLPWPTFVENVSGALLLGLALTLLLRRRPGSRGLRAFVGTGVLGAYTTSARSPSNSWRWSGPAGPRPPRVTRRSP